MGVGRRARRDKGRGEGGTERYMKAAAPTCLIPLHNFIHQDRKRKEKKRQTSMVL